jgi:hypothetical protein
MATKLKITKVSGEVQTLEITPSIEYQFELYAKKGFYKAFREDEKQSDVYWLAWKCLSKIEDTDAVFSEKFVDTLASVEVIKDESPKA